MKVLKDFYADWCAPCHQMEPVIEELEKTFTVEKIDVDANPAESQKYNVMSIPTYVVEEDDKVLDRFIGVTSKEVLEKALRE